MVKETGHRKQGKRNRKQGRRNRKQDRGYRKLGRGYKKQAWNKDRGTGMEQGSMITFW